MGLPSSDFPADWSAQIGESAELFMNCVVDIVDPNTETTTPYNPATGAGGVSTPTKLFENIPMRVQQLRAPYNVQSGVDWNAYRHYRFQCKLSDVSTLVPKGMQLVVVSGGRDQSLVGAVCTVEASTNSGHAAVRTFETTTPNV